MITEEKRILKVIDNELKKIFKKYKILTSEDGEALYSSKVYNFNTGKETKYNSWELIDPKFSYFNGQQHVSDPFFADTVRITNFIDSEDKNNEYIESLEPIYVVIQPISKFVFNYNYYGKIKVGSKSYRLHDVLVIQVFKKTKNASKAFIDRGYKQFASKDTIDTFDDLFKNL